jgi:hypothetical protein
LKRSSVLATCSSPGTATAPCAPRGPPRLGAMPRQARAPQCAGGLRTPPGVRCLARSRPGSRSKCVRLKRTPRVLAEQHRPAAHRAAGGRVGERLAVQLEGRRQRRVGGRPVEACTASNTASYDLPQAAVPSGKARAPQRSSRRAENCSDTATENMQTSRAPHLEPRPAPQTGAACSASVRPAPPRTRPLPRSAPHPGQHAWRAVQCKHAHDTPARSWS